MACNNYEVIDLGVMVSAERIVAKAIETDADAVGLSGLITPSLDEMVNVACEMQKAGLNIPLIVGGATTSEMHVALKIAPVYNGPVVWAKDAANNIVILSKLLNKREKRLFVEELQHRYEYMRCTYQAQQPQLVSIDEARKNRLKLFE